jgi:hypothetical protein
MDLPRVGLDDLNSIPRNEPADRPRHSWIPSSLIQLAAHPPAPPTIGNILYPGKRTLLSGETESLKTWLALILAKAEMELEIPVAWVDLDDMGAGALLQRLRALQVPDSTIDEFFFYYQPEERLKGEQLQDVLMQLTVTGTRMMVIDAFTPALHLHGLSPDSNIDIEAFWKDVADPIAKTGTAPVVIDHVVKDKDSRGKYASGSERKASGATVHIGSHTLNALAIGTTGRTLLTTHKDRPGYLPRPTIGVLTLASDGAWIDYRLDADKSHDTGTFRPTVLMQRISQKLEPLDEPVSRAWVETTIKGNRQAIRTALDTLASEGHLEQITGPRNSHMFTSLKPYREADEPPADDLALTSPDLALKLGRFGVSTSSPTLPLLSGEGEVGEPTTEKLASSPDPASTNGQSADFYTPNPNAFLDTEPDAQDAQ